MLGRLLPIKEIQMTNKEIHDACKQALDTGSNVHWSVLDAVVKATAPQPEAVAVDVDLTPEDEVT